MIDMIIKIIYYQIIFFVIMYLISLFFLIVIYSQEKDYYEKKDFNKFKEYIDKKLNTFFKFEESFSMSFIFFLFIPILGFIYTTVIFTFIIGVNINEKFLISKKIVIFNKKIIKMLNNIYNKFLEKIFNFFVKEYNELKETEKK